MPQTYTDDVAAILPSALTGPFQVVDPADANSYLRVDPQAARLTATGTARPWRTLVLPFGRADGVTAAGTIGTALDARRCGADLVNGFFTAPVAMPYNLDPAEPARVRLLLAPLTPGGGDQIARLEVVCTFGKDGDLSVVDETVVHDWTTPSGWSTEDVKLVLLDNGSGYTLAGGTLENADWLGLRVRRLGTAVEDTLSVDLAVAAAVLFEYRACAL